MRLSEAIRLGAMATGYADGFFGTEDGRACAFGAAIVAATDARPEQLSWRPGITDFVDGDDVIQRLWPWTLCVEAVCPECGLTDTVRGLVPHLNNTGAWGGTYHGWVRERTADWVQTIEDAQSEQAPQSAPVAVEAV